MPARAKVARGSVANRGGAGRRARRGQKHYSEKDLLKIGKMAIAAKIAPWVLLNKGKKKNPAGRTAEEAYRDFHGREALERIDFNAPFGSKESMLPRHTSGIGDLIEIDIRVPKDRHVRGAQFVTLSNFGECYLTEHPTMKQLYVEGGDQSLDLAKFGLDDSEPHEWEYLGELVRCVYHTTKDHLGKDGGQADYHHRFGKNELTLKKTELIKVGYHVPDEQLWFIGGGYEIPSEGIDG